MLLETLGAGLSRNLLTGKGASRAGEGTIRAVEGTIREGKGKIRAGQVFQCCFIL